MFLRIDRLQTELPPPSDPDPEGANAVQELLGGKFGEMSTLMNYTYQSFNFRGRQKLRPFYDLIANIAAEEFGHIEAVAATINSMLTGASDDSGKVPNDAGLSGLKDARIQQHAIAPGGLGALCADSQAKPWTGDNVFSSGDLVEDLTHNFFLETGARSGTGEVSAAVADAHRREWAFVLAATVRVTRDIDLAEECVQDAYARALTAWRDGGVPARPAGLVGSPSRW